MSTRKSRYIDRGKLIPPISPEKRKEQKHKKTKELLRKGKRLPQYKREGFPPYEPPGLPREVKLRDSQ